MSAKCLALTPPRGHAEPAKTGNPRVAQLLLGHADVESTMVYAHAIEDDVKGALEALAVPAKHSKAQPR